MIKGLFLNFEDEDVKMRYLDNRNSEILKNLKSTTIIVSSMILTIFCLRIFLVYVIYNEINNINYKAPFGIGVLITLYLFACFFPRSIKFIVMEMTIIYSIFIILRSDESDQNHHAFIQASLTCMSVYYWFQPSISSFWMIDSLSFATL
jgi:hypothetical protein